MGHCLRLSGRNLSTNRPIKQTAANGDFGTPFSASRQTFSLRSCWGASQTSTSRLKSEQNREKGRPLPMEEADLRADEMSPCIAYGVIPDAPPLGVCNS